MNYKKFFMWVFVFLTIVSIYVLFNHSSVPLLYVYFIHPVVCSVGLLIAGLIGREYLVGSIILKAIIFTIAVFSIILIITSILGGVGIIYWLAGFLYPVFNGMLVFGFILSILKHGQ